VAERKAFLLRVDPAVLEALQAWANDELRSLNGQIEYLLRQALRDAGRLKGQGDPRVPASREHKSA
jgi:hypothetical protein